MAVRYAIEVAHVGCALRRSAGLSVRCIGGFGGTGPDVMAMLEKKKGTERKNEQASAYLENRDAPKVTVGGEGYVYVPPLARGGVSAAADRASVGGSAAEQSIKLWLAEGKDQGLAGAGMPLAEKAEHNQMFTSDAGTNALNRALNEAGLKPASILAQEELTKAEDRVIKALKYAIRKGSPSRMELEQAARIPRTMCAERIREYNNALMGDKEIFGSQWPLQQRTQRSFEEELTLAGHR